MGETVATTSTAPKVGDLRVWHIPQVPGEPFIVPVSSVDEGVQMMDVLAAYDLFQYENRIKPDYANMSGLDRYEDDGEGGFDWFDVDVEWEQDIGRSEDPC